MKHITQGCLTVMFVGFDYIDGGIYLYLIIGRKKVTTALIFESELGGKTRIKEIEGMFK